jgi:hypothetical protein
MADEIDMNKRQRRRLELAMLLAVARVANNGSVDSEYFNLPISEVFIFAEAILRENDRLLLAEEESKCPTKSK